MRHRLYLWVTNSVCDIYIHVYMYKYIYTYIYTCMYIYMCVYIYISINTCVHTYIYIFIYIRTYPCIFLHIHVNINTHTITHLFALVFSVCRALLRVHRALLFVCKVHIYNQLAVCVYLIECKRWARHLWTVNTVVEWCCLCKWPRSFACTNHSYIHISQLVWSYI